MTRETLHFNELSPMDGDFLNPAVWGNHAIGDDDHQPYRAVPVGVRTTLKMISAVNAARQALLAARSDPRFRPAFSFRAGQTFPTNEFPGARIVFDQEVLVTLGPEPFSLEAGEFPPQSRFQPVPFCGPEPYYRQGKRMRYLRQPAALQTVPGEHAQAALATSLENHVGTSEYYQQVGVLAMPNQVRLGDVTHLRMHGGHEMLLRTNNVYVFPDGRPVVHVPLAPVPTPVSA